MFPIVLLSGLLFRSFAPSRAAASGPSLFHTTPTMKCLPLTTAEAKPVAAKMASSAAPIPVLKLKRDTDINRMNHSEAGEDLFGGSDAGRENRGHLEGRRGMSSHRST